VGDSDYTYTVCPYCGRRVEPDARDVIYARKQVDLPGSGQQHDVVDGEGGFFHPECSPEDDGYARRPRPDG
jgi:hypothetical protein